MESTLELGAARAELRKLVIAFAILIDWQSSEDGAESGPDRPEPVQRMGGTLDDIVSELVESSKLARALGMLRLTSEDDQRGADIVASLNALKRSNPELFAERWNSAPDAPDVKPAKTRAERCAELSAEPIPSTVEDARRELRSVILELGALFGMDRSRLLEPKVPAAKNWTLRQFVDGMYFAGAGAALCGIWSPANGGEELGRLLSRKLDSIGNAFPELFAERYFADPSLN